MKLIALAKRVEGAGGEQTDIRVHPGLVPLDHPLARVKDAMNTIVFRGKHSGETIYSGAGAGAEPTAAAVVADLADIVRKNGALTSPEAAESASQLLPLSEARARHYMRVRVIDRPGALADCARILAEHSVSIDMIRQNISAPHKEVDVVMVTHSTRHGAILDAAAVMERLESVVQPVVAMMMEDSDA